jgi:hypothetical protein
MLQVPSGSLISSPAAHGEPPKAADGPSKAGVLQAMGFEILNIRDRAVADQ